MKHQWPTTTHENTDECQVMLYKIRKQVTKVYTQDNSS